MLRHFHVTLVANPSACSNNSEEVDIRSVSLQIQGSELVHSLQLNKRVAFEVTCKFTHSFEGDNSAESAAHNNTLNRVSQEVL